MKTDTLGEGFDCLKMKSDIQAKVYAEVKDMNANERIAYYKEGSELFWKHARANLSEKSLAKDWDTPDEDEAWKTL